MIVNELIETLRYKANNIKAKIEPEIFNKAADSLEILNELEKRKFTLEALQEYMKFEDELVNNNYTFKSIIKAREKQVFKFVECNGYKGQRHTRYKCPNCKVIVRNGYPYCANCGQAIKFPKLKKVNNKIEFDWSETE